MLVRQQLNMLVRQRLNPTFPIRSISIGTVTVHIDPKNAIGTSQSHISYQVYFNLQNQLAAVLKTVRKVSIPHFLSGLFQSTGNPFTHMWIVGESQSHISYQVYFNLF